jgi:hypothetical protein
MTATLDFAHKKAVQRSSIDSSSFSTSPKSIDHSAEASPAAGHRRTISMAARSMSFNNERRKLYE